MTHTASHVIINSIKAFAAAHWPKAALTVAGFGVGAWFF